MKSSIMDNVLDETERQAIVHDTPEISKFSHLLDAVVEQSRNNKPIDVFNPLAKYKFSPANGGGLPFLTRLGKDESPIFLADHAWRQICQLANIPYSYASTLDNAQLQNVCMNHAIQHRQTNRKGNIDINRMQMIRTLNGEGPQVARAVLSDRYAEFDDQELLEIMIESIPDRDTSVVRSHIDPWGSSKFWITWDLKTSELRVGDVIKAGIQITNSETGQHSVEIKGMTYRLWCLNGATTPQVMSKSRIYHSGHKDRMKGLVTSAIDSALEDSTKLVGAYKNSLDIEINDMAAMLDGMVEKQTVNQKERDLIESNIEERDSNSLFGLSQAVTLTAKDRGFEREGQLLDLGAYMVLAPRNWSN